MDSIQRIFNLVSESSHMKKKKVSKKASKKSKKMKGMVGPTPKGAANRYDHDSFGKVNASTEIAHILNLIKEAYQDELISEEAFLAIADPILRSLMEVKYQGTEQKGTVTAGPKGRTKIVTGPKAKGLNVAARRRLTREYGSGVGNPPEGTPITYSKK